VTNLPETVTKTADQRADRPGWRLDDLALKREADR
jgi:hypothetical protein